MMFSRFPRLYTGLALLLLCFEELLLCVHQNPVSATEIAFSKALQTFSNPALDQAMFAVSIFERWPFAIFAALSMALLFYCLEGRRAALYILSSFVTGTVVSLLIKNILYRPRPSSELMRVLVHSTTSSFPSGTVIFYVIFFGFLTVLGFSAANFSSFGRSLIITVSLLLIITIGVARIYLGAHWVTDVIGGYIIGTVVLVPFTMCYLKRKLYHTDTTA